MDILENMIQRQVHPVLDVVVRLGAFDFRLISNVIDFPAQQFFSAEMRRSYTAEKTDFELWCVSLLASSLDINLILPHIDHTYRGKSFAEGYYVTDHFGAPVYLATRGRRYYVFGEKLESVVWPYFVKHFLMLHTLDNESLHLKAAACSFGSAGTLLLGRSGAGKTVFLTQLCLNGARFISNSHSIIKNGYVYGVASSMRIRPGPWYESLTKTFRTSHALSPGELIIDPYEVFDVNINETQIINICILDFNKAGQHIIRKLPEQEAYDYAEQFSLAINVYRLEEDLLDLYKGKCGQFSQAYNLMKTQLRHLINQSNCYYISSDILNSKYRNDVLALLSSSS